MAEPSAGAEAVEGALATGLRGLRFQDEGEEGPTCPQLLVPGSTVPHHDPISAPAETPPPPAAVVEHSWGTATASDFAVRAAHYKKLGRKAPSAGDFYQLKAFDLIQTPRGAVDHIARGMDLSPLIPQSTHPDLPPLFLVNCQLPDTEPAMFGSADDGPSRSAVFVFAVRPETVAALNEPDAEAARSPALKLLVEYSRRAPVDADVRGRFKVIASCRNLEDLALPAFIANYNGKPVLITKSGSLHHGPSYVEMDIRVHRFSFLARKGLAALRSRFAQMVLDVAFLVEGRGDEELPEELLGCARLHRLSYDEAAPEGVLPLEMVNGGGGGREGAGNGGGSGGGMSSG